MEKNSSPLLASKEWTPSSLNARQAPTNKVESKRCSSAPNTPDRSASSVLARQKKAMATLIMEAQIQSLKWTTGHSPLPSSPSKRKRSHHIEQRNSTLLPSLASVASASHRRKRTSTKTSIPSTNNISPQSRNKDPPTDKDNSSSTLTHSSPPSSTSPHPTTKTAHKTALQCITYATRRQTAARNTYASTTALSKSLKNLLLDSTLAVSLARKSRDEAERAAERAESSAKKIREAKELAERDVERACLEVEEADAQALEATEFLRRVEGLMGGGVSVRRGRSGIEKGSEDDSLQRVGAVVEVFEGNGSHCSSVESSMISSGWDQKIGKAVNQPFGERQQEFSDLPFRQQMKRTWEERILMQTEPLAKPLRKFQGHGSPITQIATLDSKRFISSSWDKTIRLWDAEKGTCIRSYHGHGDWVHTVAVLNDACFLSGSDDRTIKLWSITEGECIRTYSGHESFVKALSVVSCEKHFLSGSRDKTIKLWDIRSGKCVQTYRGHRDAVSAVVNLSSNRFASGSFDRSIKIWDLPSGKCVRSLVRHSGQVKSLAVVQDSTRSASQLIVSAADDKTMLLWDPASGQSLCKFECTNSLIFSVSFICDCFFLSCGGNILQLWHIPSGNCVKMYETPSLSMAVARLDDVKFVTGSDKILYLWNLFLS